MRVPMRAPTRVRDRASGRVVEERVFGGDTLQVLYGTRSGRLLTDLVLSRKPAHWIYGWLKCRPASRKEIPEFVSSLGIDASEAELPLDAYGSLDAFFTRRLKPGSRPFDPTPNHLCAPAEGRVLVRVLDGDTLVVKGCRVGLTELCGSRAIALRYHRGAALVVRLAPADYHRFHFPDGGMASAPRLVSGRLHSVHPIALAARAPSFRNFRVVTELASDGFGTLVLVEVGALTVGKIEQLTRPGRVERGQEKGLFRLGGSTVILLTEPGRVEFDRDLIEASDAGLETLVRVGTRVGVGSLSSCRQA